MPTVRQVLLAAKQSLQDLPAKYSDAVLLLADVLGVSKEKLIAFDEIEVNIKQQKLFNDCVQRLHNGEPVAYITGHKEFWSLDFLVNSNCLVPRPDTECLVEWILQNYANDAHYDVLDIGTGSGAIACSLASERDMWNIIATDNSQAALHIAEHNSKRFNLNNIKFIHGDLFTPLRNKKFNIIVSNPPYIAEGDGHLPYLQHEPTEALVAPNYGYADLITIINSAQDYMLNGACLVLEHGYQQSEKVLAALMTAGYINVSAQYDYSGNPRFVTAYKGN